MFIHHTFVALALAFGISFCTSIKVLPIGEHSGEPSKAFKALRDVIIHPRSDQYSGELPPRLHFPAKRLMPHAPILEDSAAAVKRTLLGIRQSCPAGYGYCYYSDGAGKCCNDGSCATSSQTCCLYGDRCNNDTKCCGKGCAPKDTDCCATGHYCDLGYFCCGDGVCAPEGGECCQGGSVCPKGTICVLYNYKLTCCKDISCSEFTTNSGGDRGSGNAGGKAAPPAVSASSISIPDVSISSFSPADYSSLPSATILSLPSVPTYGAGAAVTSLSIATLTAQSTPNAILLTFTSTLTIYYYTIFITTTTFIRTESTFVTSSYTSFEQEVTALATDELDATLIFGTLALSVLDAPTQMISGSGVADFSYTRFGSSETGAGVAGEGGAMSAGERGLRRWEWGIWVWGLVAMGIGAGIVVL
ncbi:MAG: hypothetical protein Q9166_005115 [cf. Caloplaca sp. 2 TL-2023]